MIELVHYTQRLGVPEPGVWCPKTGACTKKGGRDAIRYCCPCPCGAGDDGGDEEIVVCSPLPEDVTCPVCKRSKIYKEELGLPMVARYPPPPSPQQRMF